VSLFQQPSQGDKFTVGDHVGSLCLFFVHDIRQGIATAYGEKEAVACDIHVLDGPGAGEISHDALIFQGALIGSLRSAAGGDPVLARIGRGVAKPGQQPPFILGEYTADDARAAEEYLAARARRFQGNGPTTPAPGAPQAPAATASAPAQAPANGSPKGAAPPAAATPSATAASPVSGNTVDLSTLPPEVIALLQKSGTVPPF
jgi:hypothetical protein